ncbi:hypothetical protein [Leptolyngbya sp. GGD]|uniref:hypothetical protein n=1 Tax=Leptolyngbya sp. GGD TaxID=2997907 RepID=UPI00227A0F63|nr:hypothetical protein [Leptolyngbya sp. GGD]MCY6494571.1 hypothetical protein [Leptolyngbya sp. GGD]
MNYSKEPTVNRYIYDAVIGANASTTAAIAFGMTGVGFLPFLGVAALGAGAVIAIDKALQYTNTVK